MNLIDLKNELSVRSKNGIPFLLSATVIWTIITIIFLQPIETNLKNIFMLFSTGLMFPVSVLIAKVIKAEWQTNDHPLGGLGLYLNIAQFIYFPILFWAFGKSPEEMVMLFAVITGAHLFPYGWLYNTKAFYIIAPFISVIVMIIGYIELEEGMWAIPLTMVISLVILNSMLYSDYKKKRSMVTINSGAVLPK